MIKQDSRLENRLGHVKKIYIKKHVVENSHFIFKRIVSLDTTTQGAKKDTIKKRLYNKQFFVGVYSIKKQVVH